PASSTAASPFRRVRGLELISKCPCEDEDHSKLEEGEVVGGFAVTAGGDPPFRLQPRVRAFDRPAVARLRVGRSEPSPAAAPDQACRRVGGEGLASPARLADPGLDPPREQRLPERPRGLAAGGPPPP